MKNSNRGFQKIITVILTVVVASGAIVGGAYAYKIWIVPAMDRASNNAENSDGLIGGQKDEHGCLVAAGYSWCEAKQKCLRVWEESCASAQDEQGIKQAFSEKYNKPVSEINVQISKDDGNYAFGSVTFGLGGPGEGGYFFAYKDNAVWKISADGNGSVACKYLEYYGFPEDMIKSTCYDSPISINFTKTGNLVSQGEEYGSKIWALLYEEAGKPAMTTTLIFRQDSFCDFGSGSDEPCVVTKLSQGMMVKIEGDLEQGKVTVSRMAVIK